MVLGVQDLDRLALFRGQAPAAGLALAGVLGRVLAEDLVRVLDAQPGPGALFGVAQRAGLAIPDAVVRHLGVQFGLGRAVEEVPLEVVFADVVLAEPVEIVQHIRGLGRAVLAGFLTARVFADPRRGLRGTRHTPPSAVLALLRVGDGHVETEGIRLGHRASFPSQAVQFKLSSSGLKG